MLVAPRGDTDPHTAISRYFIVTLSWVFGLSELALLLRRRAKSGTSSWHRGSLRRLWLLTLASMIGALLCARPLRWAGLPKPCPLLSLGLALLCLGLLLRWYAIVYLSRLFTIDVAIAEHHRVIDSGPHRYLSHRSYSGWLLTYIGLGIGLANWVARLVISVPTTLANLQRLRIEQRALTASLGESYRRYDDRTARLVPFIY